MCPRSIAGVLFDSVRRFRATLLLRTTCIRLWGNWVASCVVALQNKNKKVIVLKVPPKWEGSYFIAYCGGNNMWKVMNVFSKGFWGNRCEQFLNSHYITIPQYRFNITKQHTYLNAEASQSRRRPAPQAILERSDSVFVPGHDCFFL